MSIDERKLNFINRAKDIHGDKYDYSLVDYKNQNTNIIIKYNDIEYIQKPSKHLIGRCPEKNTPTRTTGQFIEESIAIWGNKYDYSLVEYVNSFIKVKIIYDGVIYEQQPRSHLGGLGVESTITIDNFFKRAKSVHGDKYDYSCSEFIDSNTPILIGYNGETFLQKPIYHLYGGNPENIALSIKKDNETYIKECKKNHNNKYTYDKCIYENIKTKVIITCPVHGDFEQNSLSHLQGCGCPKCKNSKGETSICCYLDDNNIEYITQHTFDECKYKSKLRFDFYIPSLNSIIEYDGEQHFMSIERFGGDDALMNNKIKDEIKNKYCLDNNINLLRISYLNLKNIHQILDENIKIKIK